MVEHVTVYRQEGRYAGWPANYGIWSWDDEIVVGFTLGYHQSDAGFHTRDRSRPFVTMQARSLDGGKTWSKVLQNAPFSIRYALALIAYEQKLFVTGGSGSSDYNDTW